MARVFINAGHGGKDPGAVGYIVEKDVNLNMAIACKEYLEAHGVEVRISRSKDEDETLNEITRECNEFNPDLAISIHNNAGGGDGFEVYHTIYGGTGKTLAENIEAEVKAIGQNSRGVKTRKGSNGDYYAFIRNTKAPAVICEGVFVDNAADAAQADTLQEQKDFGVSYAKGALKTLGVNPVNPVKPVDDKKEVIRSLQHAYNVSYNAGLAEDGIKGPKTEAAMKKYVVRNYKENELARWVQDRLVNHKKYGLTIDGKYGKDTERVVKQFQKDNGLLVDGIAGYQTISILI